MPSRSRTVRDHFVCLGRAVASFFRDGCGTLAAALSYFSLLSLFPLLIVLVSVLGAILGESRLAYRWTLTMIQILVPNFELQLVAGLNRIIQHSSTGFWAMAALLWMALQVFLYLERAMNRIFKSPSRFGMIRSFWMSLLMLSGTGLLMLLSVLLTLLLRWVRKMLFVIGGGNLSPFAAFFPLFIYLIPVMLTLFAFSLLYRYLPSRPVAWRHALLAAGGVSILMEGAKQLFGWYVEDVADFKGIYGPLTTVVLFLLWVYFSSALFFLGGEWVYQLQETGGGSKGRGRRKGPR